MAKKKGPYVEIIGKWKHECVSPSRRYDTNLETGEVIIADTFCTCLLYTSDAADE